MAPPPKFTEFVADYGAGILNDQLSAALAEIADKVRLVGKPGKLTVTFSFKPDGGGLVVTPAVKAAPPELKEGGLFFFVTADGVLSRRDPNQPRLPSMED